MNLYRVYPEPGQVDTGAADAADTLAEWFAPDRDDVLRWALVATPRGDVHDSQGTSTGLSNSVDRAILRTLRSQAHAVVTAASTLRVEAVPVPDLAPLVVLSRRGELADHKVPQASLRPQSVIVLTGDAGENDPTEFFPPGVASHIRLPQSDRLDPGAVLSVLRDRKMRSILLEAGQQLGSLFVEAGLVDECVLSLTSSPRSESHPPLPWWQAQWGSWSASAVFTDDQRYLYTRYHPPRGLE